MSNSSSCNIEGEGEVVCLAAQNCQQGEGISVMLLLDCCLYALTARSVRIVNCNIIKGGFRISLLISGFTTSHNTPTNNAIANREGEFNNNKSNLWKLKTRVCGNSLHLTSSRR